MGGTHPKNHRRTQENITQSNALVSTLLQEISKKLSPCPEIEFNSTMALVPILARLSLEVHTASSSRAAHACMHFDQRHTLIHAAASIDADGRSGIFPGRRGTKHDLG
jgi:hypothetical protein